MLHLLGRFPGKAVSCIPYSAGGARRLALRGCCEGKGSAGAGWNRGVRKKGRGGGEGPGKASGGISRGLEFWREFVEDGACCDRVSLGESERWEPGKLRASRSPRRAAGSRAAARLASGGRGGGVACAERGGGVWPCAARSALLWLGLRRVRAGGDGGEAGGCGRECGPARGARGLRARSAPSAPPLAGPVSRPRAALFVEAVVAFSRAGAPGPGRFVSPRCPPRLSTPGPLFRRLGRFVRPVAPRILSPSPPLICPSSLAPLLCPSLFGSSVTCHSPGTRFLFFF